MGYASIYMNGAGQYLDISNWTSVKYAATAPGQVVRGATGDNNLYDTAGGDTMVGGSGDNTYTVSDPSTVVEQAANGTTDTVVAWK